MAKKALRLLLCLLFCLPAHGLCCEITTAQLETLESNLTALQANNQRLSELLSASESDLTTARSDLDSLLKELATANAELWRLKTELQTASDEAKQAKQSLRTANDELRNACQSARRLEQKRLRARRQRILWQAIAVAMGGVVIHKT